MSKEIIEQVVDYLINNKTLEENLKIYYKIDKLLKDNKSCF